MPNDSLSQQEFNYLDDFPPQTFAEWKAKVEKDLKSQKFESLFTEIYEGIKLKPIYSIEDLSDYDYHADKPGFIDFRRGNNPDGTVNKGWLTAITIPFNSIENFNDFLNSNLSEGLNTFVLRLNSTAFNGMKISTVEDLSGLFENFNLKKPTLFIETGYSPFAFLLIFKAFLNKKGLTFGELKGGITADPLEVLLLKGTLPASFNEVLNEIKLSINFLSDRNKNLKALNISSLPISEGGGNITQELAYIISAGVEYLNALADKGLPLETISNSIKFTMGIGSFHFLEIAKFRAARILWNNILSEYGLKPNVFIHAKNVIQNKSILDIHNNILRITGEAFSAIVGGVDLLETIPYDFLSDAHSTLGIRLARNTQLILKEEAHLSGIIDPAGGAFFIENITNELASAAWEIFKQIQAKGGIFQSLKNGWFQNLIKKNAGVKSLNFFNGKDVLIGVNKFVNLSENIPPRAESNYNTKNNIRSINEPKFEKELRKLKINKENILNIERYDLISKLDYRDLQLFFSNKSKAEIISPLTGFRNAELFENIRISSERFKTLRGRLPAALIALYGVPDGNKNAAYLAKNIFAVSGFNITSIEFEVLRNQSDFNPSEATIFCKNNWNTKELEEIIKFCSAANLSEIFLCSLSEPELPNKYQNIKLNLIYSGNNNLELINIYLNKILQ